MPRKGWFDLPIWIRVILLICAISILSWTGISSSIWQFLGTIGALGFWLKILIWIFVAAFVAASIWTPGNKDWRADILPDEFDRSSDGP